jgi:hypothetical protein
MQTDDLAEAIGWIPDDENVLVVAHPCSGTRWLQHVIHERTSRAVYHERPPKHANRNERGHVMISYRYWGLDTYPYDHIFHLVREPIRVVYSMAHLVAKIGPAVNAHLAGFIWRIPSLEASHLMEITESGYTLKAALWTVTAFNKKADKLEYERYRIEDVEDVDRDADLPRNSHNRDVTPDFKALQHADVIQAYELANSHFRYGYEPPR